MMDRRLLVAATVLILILTASSFVSDADADGSSPAASSGLQPSDIKDDSVVSASGRCGTGDGAATWSYSRSEDTSDLSLSDGSVSSYRSWTVTSLKIDDAEATAAEIAGFKADDILKGSVVLTVNGSVSAESGVIASLFPTKAVMNGSSVPGSFFINCTRLSEVVLGGSVSGIGALAFSGCSSLVSFDIGKAASVDQTAFKGCTKLTAFKAASDNGTYSVVGGMLCSDGGKTLYLIPTAKTGSLSIGDIGTKVVRIFLGYADVDLVLDVNGDDRTISFEKVSGLQDREIKTRGFVYSSQGMKSSSVAHTISAGSSQSDVFTISYTLYDGWAVVEGMGAYTNADAKLDSGRIAITANDSSYWIEAFPMGVKTLRCSDLAGLSRIGDWAVDIGGLPASSSKIVTDIGPLDTAVTGYLGEESEAVLDGILYFNGVVCDVSSVGMTHTSIGELTDLTVGEGISIGDGAFANITNLKTVKADHADSVGRGAFEYCTGLTTVSFKSCVRFGEYAFQNCWALRSIDLGPSDIEFGDNALRGCRSLDLLAVGMDAEIEGADAVPVLHYDMTDTSEKTFEVVGDYIRIYWYFSSRILYNQVNDETGAEEVPCYIGSDTIVPLYAEMFVWQKYGPPSVSSNLVVFDYGMGLDSVSTTVRYNAVVQEPEAPETSGYRFYFWSYDGVNEYDFDSPVTHSMVLVAVWTKNDPVDPTPMYLGILFIAAVAGTFAVLAVARRMND